MGKAISKRLITGAAFLLCAVLMFQLFSPLLPKKIQTEELNPNHFMEQINAKRTSHGLTRVERNVGADNIAKFIYDGYEDDYFNLLDEMAVQGFGEDGQIPVFWNMTLNKPVAEQINDLEEFEQGFFANPKTYWWGEYADETTNDYVLVLIMGNVRFEEAEANTFDESIYPFAGEEDGGEHEQ